MIQRFNPRYVALLATSLLAGFVLQGCGKPAQQTAVPPKPERAAVTPVPIATAPSTPLAVAKPGAPAASVPAAVGKPGQEVAGAKALVEKLMQMKSINDMPPLLTNESAATMGTMMGGMLYMIAGMAEGFSGMGQGMAGGMGGQPGSEPKADLSKSPEMQRIKALKGDTQAVFKRYGVDLQAGPGAAASPKLKANGRAFLADVMHLMDKLPRKQGPNGAMMTSPARLPNGAIAQWAAGVKYRVVDKNRVMIITVDKQGRKQEMEARVEDGSWRLHIPDLGKLMMGGTPPPGGFHSRGPGMPGMGMPPPGGMGMPPSGGMGAPPSGGMGGPPPAPGH